MEKLLPALGILIIILYLSAALNGVKKYLDADSNRFISKYHKVFGMSASGLAIIHMSIAISMDELRLTGALALGALLLTGMFGMLLSKLKKKQLFYAHKVFAGSTFVLIVTHIILNFKY
ncbi:MAG TPA: hypothetical protein VJY66_04245 [Acholeplasma sp.]|nr:hypothetical protein [Acholeplasma sp.]